MFPESETKKDKGNEWNPGLTQFLLEVRLTDLTLSNVREFYLAMGGGGGGGGGGGDSLGVKGLTTCKTVKLQHVPLNSLKLMTVLTMKRR